MTKSELALVRAVSNENSRLRAALQLIALHCAKELYDWETERLADQLLRIITTSYSAGAA